MRLIISTREPTDHSTGRVRARPDSEEAAKRCVPGWPIPLGERKTRLLSHRRQASSSSPFFALLGADGPAPRTGAARRGCDCPPRPFGDKGAPFARAAPERSSAGSRAYLPPAKERTRHGVQQRHFPVLLPAVVPPGLLRDALQQMGSGGVQHRFLCLGRADLRRAAVCVDRRELRARAEDRAGPRLRPGPALGRRRHRPQPDPAAAVQVQRAS